MSKPFTPRPYQGHIIGHILDVDRCAVWAGMGMDQYTRKWSRLKSYGGKFFENICQRVAREVMGDNMPAIEAYGYAIVTSVHDELPTEAPDTPEFNHRHLSALLATNPDWAPDMPLAAAGFESPRYKKD